MVESGLQTLVYLVSALVSALTAFLGIFFANHALRKRNFSNVYSFFFSSLGFGYACFALAELCWFLIFHLFSEQGSGSMPDFYWVVGSFSLFLGFTLFYLFTSSKQGKLHRILILILILVISALGLYYLLKMGIMPSDASSGQTFLSYFYPIMSTFILISSVGVYLSLTKQGNVGTPLLLMVITNVLFLVGDLLYAYAAFESTYSLTGLTSDILYILAYLSCCASFFYFLTRIDTVE